MIMGPTKMDPAKEIKNTNFTRFMTKKSKTRKFGFLPVIFDLTFLYLCLKFGSMLPVVFITPETDKKLYPFIIKKVTKIVKNYEKIVKNDRINCVNFHTFFCAVFLLNFCRNFGHFWGSKFYMVFGSSPKKRQKT